MRTLLATLALGLVACGGTPSRGPTQAELDAETEEDRIDSDDDYEDDEGSGGSIDPALLRAEVAPLVLGDAVTLPGTGVSLRPPEGSEPMPFGSGFLARRQRVQISVVVAVGEESVLDAIRSGGGPTPPDPEDVEEVEIAGQTGRIGRDRIRTQAGVLERVWLLVHDGTRGLGVVATYEEPRSDAYRGPMREALAAVEWDREVDLDAAAALGVAIDEVQGLEISRRSTANLVMLEPGAEFPPEAGQVVLTVAPLPMAVPPDRATELCGRIASQLVPAPTEDVELEGPVDDGQLPGCERLATAPTNEGPRVVTYAAVLFHQGMPLLVTASVDAEQLDTWRPRFASAARSLRMAQ